MTRRPFRPKVLGLGPWTAAGGRCSRARGLRCEDATVRWDRSGSGWMVEIHVLGRYVGLYR